MEGIVRLRCTAVALACVAHAGFFAARADAQEVTLKVHHLVAPAATAHARVIAPWCDKLAKESAGRLKCQIYPAMQLGGTPPQLYDQAKDGVADIVWTVTGYNANRFPVIEAFELPFMLTNAEAGSRALWDFVQQYNKAEFNDVHPLAFHVHGPGVFHMREKPIKTLADLKGQKVRAPTRVTNELLAVLGATPVGIPLPGVPEALSKGVINGTVIPWEIVPSVKVEELTKYHSETDPKYNQLYSSVFVFAMNKARYNGLPRDLKTVLDANSGPSLSAWFGKMFVESDVTGRETTVKAGGQFNTIPVAELEKWRTLAQPVVDGWVRRVADKGHDGRNLLEAARALIAKYTK